MAKPDVDPITALNEQLDLDPDQLQGFTDEFSSELHRLAEQYRMTLKARETIQERFPQLAEHDPENYDVTVGKACFVAFQEPLYVELEMTVRDNSGPEARVYCVQWLDKDYPDLGQRKGFTVLQHKDPETHRANDRALIEKWDEIPATDEYGQTIIGIALYKCAKKIVKDSKDNIPMLLDTVPVPVSD
ncbi:hypothetical protein JW710_02050 [Candidatus Dojkabacteria bacterium]|nr:hypothetical protein [Candidatus Dojkabacteria bacterium]